jgi:hypothetical protein
MDVLVDPVAYLGSGIALSGCHDEFPEVATRRLHFNAAYHRGPRFGMVEYG